MTNDLKQAWLTALRSGKYEQIRRRLKVKKNDGICGFCCLGVLCEVAELPEIETSHQAAGEEVAYGVSRSYCSLDTELLAEVGLDADLQVELMRLNDDERFTFNQIADYLEKQ